MPGRIPPEQWLSRRRWRSRLTALLLTTVFSALLVWRGVTSEGVPPDRLAVRLVAVESPTTVRLEHDGAISFAFRLAGVQGDEVWATRAADEIQRVCAGAELLITFDERSPDRNVGHVYLPDGRMLNEWLISQGFLRADDSDDFALREWFSKLESVAMRRKVGMWANPKPAAPPHG